MKKKFLFLTIISSVFMLSFKMISNNPEKRFWDWFIENEKYIYENVENPKEQEKIFENDVNKIIDNLGSNIGLLVKEILK